MSQAKFAVGQRIKVTKGAYKGRKGKVRRVHHYEVLDARDYSIQLDLDYDADFALDTSRPLAFQEEELEADTNPKERDKK